MSLDREYYRRRVATEREMALRAECRDVAAIHEELARPYQALLDQPELRSTHSIVSHRRPLG